MVCQQANRKRTRKASGFLIDNPIKAGLNEPRFYLAPTAEKKQQRPEPN